MKNFLALLTCVSIAFLASAYNATAQENTKYEAVFGHGYAVEPTAFHGAFDNQEECLAAEPAQKANFERQTGLKGEASVCEKGDSLLSPGFVLRIIGHHPENTPPQQKLWLFYDEWKLNADGTLAPKILAALSARGASSVHQTQDAFYYYAEKPVHFRHESFGYFNEPAQCREQEAEALALTRKTGSKNILIGCRQRGDSFVLDGYRDEGSLIRSDFGRTAPKYWSYAECMKDRANYLGATPYGPVIGAICAKSAIYPDRFALEIFTLL